MYASLFNKDIVNPYGPIDNVRFYLCDKHDKNIY